MKKELGMGAGGECHLDYSEPLHSGGKGVDGIIIICSEQSREGTCVLSLLKTFHINESTKEWKLNQKKM